MVLDIDHDKDEWCGEKDCPKCQGHDSPPYEEVDENAPVGGHERTDPRKHDPRS